MNEKAEELPAGRDLDALVAEKVFGRKPCKFSITGYISTLTMWACEHASTENCYPVDFSACLEKYSENICAAWLVVDKLRNKFFIEVGVGAGCLEGDPTQARACLRHSTAEPRVYVHAQTVPLAICRAALAALEHH